MTDRPVTSITEADRIDDLVDLMASSVHSVLERLEGDRFTTPQFIELLLTDPDASTAYRDALEQWGEDEEYSRMVVHGQVIPAILRRSPLVEWAGYAHDEIDPYGVPAWWQLVPRDT